MIYTLTNPHDSITFESQDEKVAIAGCMLFVDRGGYYGLKEQDTRRDICFFFPPVTEAEIAKHFGSTAAAAEFVSAHKQEIAKFFRSCIYSENNRQEFLDSLECQSEANCEAARLKWNDDHRSSMSDVSLVALDLATILEEPKGAVEHDPRTS